jgi:hypothetical protein
MDKTIITPETHPQHPVVGRDFVGGATTGRYHCDSYDPQMGFWLTPRQPANLDGAPLERINVSERAIGRTFHEVWVDNYGDERFEYTAEGWTSFLRRWNKHFAETTNATV